MQLHTSLSYHLQGAPRVYVCRSKWGVPSHAARPQLRLLRCPSSSSNNESIPASSRDLESEAVAAATADRKQLWVAAIKAPMYSVGIVPVLVGAAAAYAHTGNFSSTQCGGLLLASILIIAWLNLSNDAFDAATGVDLTKRESIVNLSGASAGLILVIANTFLVSGLGLFAHLLSGAAGPPVLCLLAVAIVCGYVYQGPPFRMSYKGLGEPLCFLAFGPCATPAFFFANLPQLAANASTTTAITTQQAAATAASSLTTSATSLTAASPSLIASSPSLPANVFTSQPEQMVSAVVTLLHSVPPIVWVLSALVGLTTTTILFCSHFHQIEGDLAAGKFSPLVRLGTEKATMVLQVAVVTVYMIAMMAAAEGLLPMLLLGPLGLTLVPAAALVRFARENHTVPSLIAPLKKFAVKWHVAVGLSLVLGISLGA